MRLNHRRWKRRQSPACLLLALLLLGTALAFGPGAQSASMAVESFYDELHGWRALEGRAEETNDGGRTWKTIAGGPEIYGVLRTGFKAGLFVADKASDVYWTNGFGGFYRSSQIGPLAVGAGSFLFWSNGKALYRVTPWPFVHECSAATDDEECVYYDARRRRRVARFTNSLALRFPDVPIGDAATIPAGVVAVSRESREPERPSRPYVATARWIGRARAKRVLGQYLPTGITPLTPCYGTLGVDWPRIVVSACTIVHGNHSPATVGVWRSLNGGREWALYRSVR